jgi:peptide/nickel transport system ATP-binding protein
VSQPGEAPPVLDVAGLSVALVQDGGRLQVLEDVSFTLAAGRTLALIGESGCGKSMAALAVLGLLPEGIRRTAGAIRLDGEDLATATPRRLQALRGSAVSMIFQEPMTALNPVFPIGEQIAETLRQHQGLGHTAARRAALEMLRAVEIAAPERRIDAYPHQLSGGMRQRVMIAIALACRPRLLIADEPTTALDVTVQAQIFDLLRTLQRETGTAILLITHDLHAVADIADEIAVLYAGTCVERGPAAAVLAGPLHPYTAGLLACTPRLRLGAAAALAPPPLAEIPGMVPPLGQRGPGCRFAPRCGSRGPDCAAPPPLRPRGTGRAVACWRVPERAA